MKPTNDGGPAFPEFMWDHMEPKRGMTLRDYFAAAALTGLISKYGYEDDDYGRDRKLPERALYLADAMLAARGGAS